MRTILSEFERKQQHKQAVNRISRRTGEKRKRKKENHASAIRELDMFSHAG